MTDHPAPAVSKEGRVACLTCGGSGKVMTTELLWGEVERECWNCGGSGDRVEWSKCGACEGDGGNASPCQECGGQGGWWLPWEPT